jgi:hypothetical protein
MLLTISFNLLWKSDSEILVVLELFASASTSGTSSHFRNGLDYITTRKVNRTQSRRLHVDLRYVQLLIK